MKIGYARVSTLDQDLSLQISALEKFGCDRIFEEKMSALKYRPELEQALTILRKGDVFIFWKLDRLGRSLSELINLVDTLNKRGIDIVSLDGSVDTTTAHGRLFFQISASFAEYERRLIVERTKAGLEEAKKRGISLGRRKGLNDAGLKKAQLAAKLYKEDKVSPESICQVLGISKSTLYRYLQRMEIKLHNNVGRKKLPRIGGSSI